MAVSAVTPMAARVMTAEYDSGEQPGCKEHREQQEPAERRVVGDDDLDERTTPRSPRQPKKSLEPGEERGRLTRAERVPTLDGGAHVRRPRLRGMRR